MSLLRTSRVAFRTAGNFRARFALAPRHHITRFSHSDAQNPNSHGHDPISHALKQGTASSNSLQAPLRLSQDPRGILQPTHPASSILEHPSIIVHRQIEMMNVMLGFEEANKYTVLDPQGSHIGYMAERDLGLANAMSRQILRTHRQFTTHIFNRSGAEVLRCHRPFSYINSKIHVYDPVDPDSSRSADPKPANDSTAMTHEPTNLRPSLVPHDQMPLIGEASSQWAPLRRKYNMYLARSERDSDDITLEDFAYIDSPFLAWDFTLRAPNTGVVLGSVDRNFSGLARELFTDAGIYALRMDSAAMQEEQSALAQPRDPQQEEKRIDLLSPQGAALTLDQRAVMLAMAISIDYDYFSRDRGGFMVMPFPMGYGGGAAAGEAAGAAGAAGAGAAAEAGAAEGAAGAVGGGLARGAAGAVTAEEAAGMAGVGGVAAAGAAGQQRRQNQPEDMDGQSGGHAAGLPGGAEAAGAGLQAPQGRATSSEQSPQEEVWGSDWDPYGSEQSGQMQRFQGREDGGQADGHAGGGGGEGSEDGGGLLDSISDFFDA